MHVRAVAMVPGSPQTPGASPSWGQGGVSDVWKLHLFIYFRGKTPTPQGLCQVQRGPSTSHVCSP